jgi:haloalkane dehalogenase
MPVIRTPEERFRDLPGYPFEPHYVLVNGMRMHYVDEGQGDVILCLHGEPSWSYLYRKMIPILAQHHRVIAPDFIGFGRSDKYTERDEYSFRMHFDSLAGFIESLHLMGITLVAQDWGGLLGLPAAASMPERFSRLVIMNTGLPTGDEPMSAGFQRWREFSTRVPDMDIGRVIAAGMAHTDHIAPEVIEAYNSPFPDLGYKAGAMVFPLLVPISPDDPASPVMRAARERLSHWEKPAFAMFSDGDPITRGGERFFRTLIPTAKDQPEVTIHEAGHFLQEEKGEEIAHHILDFIARTPLSRNEL